MFLYHLASVTYGAKQKKSFVILLPHTLVTLQKISFPSMKLHPPGCAECGVVPGRLIRKSWIRGPVCMHACVCVSVCVMTAILLVKKKCVRNLELITKGASLVGGAKWHLYMCVYTFCE